MPVPAPTADRYADWKAPAADGSLLVWPEPARLLADARQNHDALASPTVAIAGVPLNEWRRRMRAYLGFDDDTLVFATGHQAELYHPGVWAKNAVIDAAARAVIEAGGRAAALHVSVDTDAPKHLLVKWPGGAVPITDDADLPAADWSGALDQPTPSHLDLVEREFAAASAGWEFDPVAPAVFTSLRRLSLEGVPLADAVANAHHQLDWSLGLRHHALTLSPALHADPYLAFVSHVLANARRFADAYNAALADYRRETGTRSDQRPMPDLAVSGGAVEVPFWLDALGDGTGPGTRSRATVEPDGDGFSLTIHGDRFAFDPDADGPRVAADLRRFLASRRHRLAPRALSLTIFLRLFVADQWAHGIGGGRYDQVADRIVASFVGVEPPRFCVCTATLFFPEAVGRDRVCLPCDVSEGHRLRHAALGDDKMRRVREIDALPRGSAERSRAYREMHAALADAAASSERLAAWRERLGRDRARAAEEAVLFDRELPYFVQPRGRLEGVIGAVREKFAE